VRCGKKGFVSSSGGNAGVAVAYAGKRLGVKVDVFLPITSHQIFIDAIRSYGATAHVGGAAWDEAHEAALKYAKSMDAAYIPPFDHPLIWSGHATLIEEIAREGMVPDAIVVAVGGGGLASGILEGMHQVGWYDIPLFAVQTEGAASLYQSIKENKPIVLSTVNTIATSLATKRITPQLLDWTKKHSVTPLIVSDKACVLAIKRFVDHQRVLVEPSSGAALSVVYDQHPELEKYQSILVIVCGGIGISLDLLENYMRRFNLVEQA
jgi:L-serine/L-threonine ammonia-lyase